MVLVRESLVDHAADNPTWRCSRRTRRSTTRTPTRARSGAGRPSRAAPRRRQLGLAGPWDVDSRPRVPTRTTGATTRSRSTTGTATIRSRSAPSAPRQRIDREYTYPWTNQWHTSALQPGGVRLAAAQRHRRRAGEPVRDAQPDARLLVPPRLHRDGWNLQSFNFARGGAENDPEQRQCAGRRAARRHAAPSRDNANQFTLPTAGPDHEHVPVAAASPPPSTPRAWTATTTCR